MTTPPPPPGQDPHPQGPGSLPHGSTSHGSSPYGSTTPDAGQQPHGQPGGYAPGGPQFPGQYPAGGFGHQASDTDRTMAILAHLSSVIANIVSVSFGGFLGPLLIWLFYKDKSAFVRRAAAGSFNFNLTVSIAFWALFILAFLTLGLGLLIAIPGWLVIGIVYLWCTIHATIRASNGEAYEYPLQIPVLR
ncbi:hypothetical protein SAMN05445756_1822 [Kytococcus aerolatus]|uniref:Tic20 family protein n=1 Tax=Kytococcus aerolatus TaxID=592308 RepID=A0A212U2M5_9MICO|nr:DUF4870 domain-containing protein [Kytococcus aerolatus]SNC72374.1 hypothetical protein SAMN05445756_1822 [Kytococcus aerolatus]